ncbi:MAG: hypothetical protein KUG72_03300, partial [Pseudomonadales bacterium]|nr:hypothetical protein [Pseudomonadales bacterium]
MSRFSDTILWNWVKPEIESAINITVGALHQLSELPDSTDKLGECIEPLRQSQGAFYYTRLPIAAALIEALTQALRNIQQHNGDVPRDLFKHVTDAALSLSTFVDRHRGDDQNDELRLLPFLHDILAISGHSPIAEYGFDFSNRLNTISDDKALSENYFPEATSVEQVDELHRQYQLQMATLDKIHSSDQPRNEKIIESLRSIREVLNHLSTIFNSSPAAETFDIACYLCEALETQKNLRRPGTFSLLNAVDSYINGLIHQEQNTHTEKTLTLLNNQILFYLVPCSTSSQCGQQIRDQYALDGILLANPFLSELIKPESYTDRKALKAVLTSFRDEIVSARTELEQQATPSTDTVISESEPLAQQFHKFSNICSILKYKNWSQLFLTSALSLPTSDPSSISENEVINLCEQLLKFEDFLASGIESNIENIVETSDRSFQFETAHRVVIKDSIESMSKVILFFEQFLSDQQDREKVDLGIEILGSIAGNLKMIGIPELSSLISDSRHYIAESISDITEETSPQELIVDFILYIQLHLESLMADSSLLDSEDKPESFVNSATQLLAQLAKKVDGHQITEQTQPETTDPVQATTLDTDLIDDEILEIFAEEAEEVLETLQL